MAFNKLYFNEVNIDGKSLIFFNKRNAFGNINTYMPTHIGSRIVKNNKLVR